MNPNNFKQRFLSFCDEYHMLQTDSILVAFSGGADSVVLLSLLHEECRDRKIFLTALHVNHMIRGDEARRDATFCEAFCKERNIPFAVRSVNIPDIAKRQKEGLEECARNERYRLLREYAKEAKITTIATAHNATDNLETLLFHLARGMSLHGAGGIHPVRGDLIRPLLPFSKQEILEYAKEAELPYVSDSSNEDTTYTRNHIRHRVLPLIYAINPDAESAALRFTESARHDDATLMGIAKQYQNCDDIHTLASLDQAILSRVLLIKIGEFANNETEYKHILDLISKIRAAANRRFHGKVSLPGKISAVITAEKFYFDHDVREKKRDNPYGDYNIPLSVGQETVFAERYLIRVSQSPQKQNDASLHLLIDPRAVKGSLFARTRQEGDTYVAGGMTRKVKKMLCDHKVSPNDRNQLPFICDSEGILWIPHLPPADRTKSSPNEESCLHIEIQDLKKKG